MVLWAALGSLLFWVVWAAVVIDVAAAKPSPVAKAAIAESTTYTNDALTAYDGGSAPNDPCASALTATHIVTSGLAQCYVTTDYLGSIRHRLGLLDTALAPLKGAAPLGIARGPLDRIESIVAASDVRLEDLADIETLATAANAKADTTNERLSVTNDRLSALDDQLADLVAATEDVSEAITAQGPNAGSPSLPGGSDATPSYVRLSSSDTALSEMSDLGQQSVMFIGGLITALVLGGMIWRSVLGGAA
ncbi:MAG: hypothetical protein JHC95_12585 [Solirubrobacteraceae bacterium]|nr:hypothetical protein [Solirubrobacteraceae bacterium]